MTAYFYDNVAVREMEFISILFFTIHSKNIKTNYYTEVFISLNK